MVVIFNSLLNSSTKVRDLLKHYFDKSKDLTVQQDKELYILCVECFEVCMFSELLCILRCLCSKFI